MALVTAAVEVVEVSPENESVLSNGKSWFIFFSLPSCHHCLRLKPAFAELAKGLQDGNVALAHVDCGENRGAALCAGLTSFPTLIWVHGGERKVYHGARDVSSLSLFVSKMSGPAVRSGVEWLDRDPDGAVVSSTDSCSGALADAFEAAALRLRDRFFFVRVPRTESEECRIEVVRAAGQEKARWSLEGNLEEFVEREATPLVSPFRKFVHATSKLPVVYMFHDGAAPPAEAAAEFREASRTVRARGRPRSVLFATVPAAEWDGARAGATKPLPSVVLVDTAQLNHHYAYSGPLAASELAAWVAVFLDGKLARTMVSEPEEPTQLANGSMRVVGSNWQRRVLADDGRDALVFFWSPHCGSSVAARPVWEQLLAALNVSSSSGPQTPTLLLAEADGWANDWSAIELSGLPDFRLFPADDKSHSKRYAGPRDAAKLLEWLRAMAFNPLPTAATKDEL